MCLGAVIKSQLIALWAYKLAAYGRTGGSYLTVLNYLKDNALKLRAVVTPSSKLGQKSSRLAFTI